LIHGRGVDREMIEACRTSATKAKKPVRCTIEVKPYNAR